MTTKKRAFLSVTDKLLITELAAGLVELGWEVVSTGGTAAAIEKAGVPVTTVQTVTQFPEMLDGRVKSLHPAIHGGILADRSKPEHMKMIAVMGIFPIDLVAVNLYDFASDPGIEQIDVGGPTLIRGAAKNYASVTVLVDPSDYGDVIGELKGRGSVNAYQRHYLALKAFRHTTAYDAMIASWLDSELLKRKVPRLDAVAG